MVCRFDPSVHNTSEHIRMQDECARATHYPELVVQLRKLLGCLRVFVLLPRLIVNENSLGILRNMFHFLENNVPRRSSLRIQNAL